MELDPQHAPRADPAQAALHLEHERRVPDGARLPRRAARLPSCSHPTSTTCRSRSSWASRCRSRRSRCSRGSSIERRMLNRPVGALAIAGAAIDDVTAWGLLALATAVAGSGSGLHAARRRRARSARSRPAMIIVGRPFLGRVSTAYDEVGPRPGALDRRDLRRRPALRLRRPADRDRGDLRRVRDGADHAAPRRPDGRRHAAASRTSSSSCCCRSSSSSPACETDVGALNRPELWLIALGLLVVAVVGKWLGAMGAARYVGPPRGATRRRSAR